ncbi:NUDIX domain-containing protein [Candidatus Daviesbacteria bacterium]|nr:NUDIX domain-containing protein [Candidatus Daviesbacteria bacterium]
MENSQGEVLLQKRKHQVFDNLWDVTASTDLSHFEDGRDEKVEEAAYRCLKREYGIEKVENLKTLGGFSYFAKDGEHCENEYDYILVGGYDGEVNMDPNVGYEYKWVKKEDFLKDIEQNPKNYTPWAIESAKILKQVGF